MANVNQEDLFLRFIPDVFIQKITLENSGFFPAEDNPHIRFEDETIERAASFPATDSLKITINLLLKEKFDDDVIGKWISNIDYKKYIKIKAFQVTNSRIASLMGTSKDFITLLDPELRSQMKPSVEGIAPSYLGVKNYSSLSEILQRDVKVQELNLIDPISDSNIFVNGNIKREVNDDGSENYNVFYRLNFNLPTSQPEHLSYFFMSVFDIQQISEDYNLKYPLLSALETTRVSSELVIEQGIPTTQTYAYLLQNGEIWAGEIHQDRQGTFRTGIQGSQNSQVLIRVKVPNSKLQDFRNIKEINKLKFDFTEVNTYFSKLKKINSSPPKPKDTRNFFRDIILTRDIDRNANFVFNINFGGMVISNTIFYDLINSYDIRIAREVSRRAKIKYLKIFRRRVKETFLQTNSRTNQVGYQPFEKNEIEETIISLSQLDSSDVLGEVNLESVFLREPRIFGFPSLRTIECTDRSMAYITDGLYQYGIEVEVTDPTYDFMFEQISLLRAARKLAEEYLTEASITSMSKFFLEVADPHIRSRKEKELVSTELEGNYDSYTNSFTKTFEKKMEAKYQDANLSPWVLAPAVYADVLQLFIEDLDAVALGIELEKMMSPISGNPSGIIATIKLIDTLISTLSSTIGVVENTDPLSRNTSPSVTKTFKIKHYFTNDVFDSDYDNTIAYEFFDESIVPDARRKLKTKSLTRSKSRKRRAPTENTRSGFLKISGNQFRAMADKETLKFFNSANPDVKNPRNLSVKDSIQTTKYTFFTPSRISTSTKDYSLSNAKSKNNAALEKDLCNKDSETKKDIMINNIRNIGIAARNNSDTIIANQNFEELENNLRALTKAIGSAASVTIELTTIQQQDLQENESPASPIGTLIALPAVSVLDSKADNLLNSGFSSFIDTIGKDIDLGTRGNTARNRGTRYPFSKDRIRTTTDTTRLNPQKIATNINNFATDKEILRLPNQLKATLLNNVGKSSVRNSAMAPSKASIAETESRFQVQLNSIKEIQVLTGYEKGENGNLLLNRPIWETLDEKRYETLPNNREIVARFVDFENKTLCTPKPTSARDVKTLNDKFILRPDTSVRVPPRENNYNIKLPTSSITVSKGLLDVIAKESVKQVAIPPNNTRTNFVPSVTIEGVINSQEVKDSVAKIDADNLAQNPNNLTTATVKPPLPSAAVTTQASQANNVQQNIATTNAAPARSVTRRVRRPRR